MDEEGSKLQSEEEEEMRRIDLAAGGQHVRVSDGNKHKHRHTQKHIAIHVQKQTPFLT